MRRIYIAGRYDDTNVISVLHNIRDGIELAVKVLREGDLPFCPFLDFLFILIGDSRELRQQHFRDYSLEWLKCCDEIWLLPSWVNSKGCQVELALAKELGLVVKYVNTFKVVHG